MLQAKAWFHILLFQTAKTWYLTITDFLRCWGPEIKTSRYFDARQMV